MITSSRFIITSLTVFHPQAWLRFIRFTFKQVIRFFFFSSLFRPPEHQLYGARKCLSLSLILRILTPSYSYPFSQPLSQISLSHSYLISSFDILPSLFNSNSFSTPKLPHSLRYLGLSLSDFSLFLLLFPTLSQRQTLIL